MHGRLKQFGKWGELHEESELLAIEATNLRGVNPVRARELYAQAAAKEEEVLVHIPKEGATQSFYEAFVVSAAALHFKAGDCAAARRVIDAHSENLQSLYYQRRLEEVVDAVSRAR